MLAPRSTRAKASNVDIAVGVCSVGGDGTLAVWLRGARGAVSAACATGDAAL
jgi:microcompartment protein CcmL/EutN